MDDSFSSRFKKLEKAREAQPGAASPLTSRGRFGPDQPAPPTEQAPRQAAPLERFRPQTSAPLPPGEEVPFAEMEPEGTQPFQRCALCEADSNRFSRSCEHCGAPFDTPEQRAFNDRVWAQHRDENARTDAELETIRGEFAKDESQARTQRLLGEALAKEVAEHERARLGWMPDGPDAHEEGVGRRETPGLRLLRLIPSTSARLLVAIALGGVGLVFAWVFLNGNMGGRAIAALFFYVMIMLFVPGGWRRRRRGWWR